MSKEEDLACLRNRLGNEDAILAAELAAVEAAFEVDEAGE